MQRVRQDIEELRRIAQAQQAQIQQLLDVIAAKSREIERLRGKPGDLHLTLKMLEALQAKANAATDAVAGPRPSRRSAPMSASERSAPSERPAGRRPSRSCP
ncbi:MAG: hypothetical protein WKG01_22390 [Kofleriaceae bacterium]